MGGPGTTGIEAAGKDVVRIISELVFEHTGIQLGEQKRYLIETRLLRVLRRYGLPSLAALCQQLQKNETALICEVVDALTTNETFWFRDQKPFEAFAHSILPEIAKRKTRPRLDIWSAGCSTGQEPYSLAMLIHANPAFHSWRVRILATDVSRTVLAQARAGLYSQLEINRGLPPEFLKKYFVLEKENRWRIVPYLRCMVEFVHHRLQDSPDRLGQFDLIFCRNVLIYFEPELKKRILEQLSFALCKEGLLCLGGSETTYGLTDRFELTHIGDATFYRPRNPSV